MNRTLQQGGHVAQLSAGGKPGHVGFQRPQFRNATGSECGGARYSRCRALRSRPPSRRARARVQPRYFPVSLIEADDLARGGITRLISEERRLRKEWVLRRSTRWARHQNTKKQHPEEQK